jgi:hypothetical protein
MAAFVKFFDFVESLGNGEHNLGTDQLEIYLSNTAPNQTTDIDKTDLAEITNENGYAAPQDTQNTASESAGTYTVSGVDVTITASGGTVGPFRYVVLFNQTHTTDALIGYWDYGSAVTLQDGESFTTDFGSDQLFTIA